MEKCINSVEKNQRAYVLAHLERILRKDSLDGYDSSELIGLQQKVGWIMSTIENLPNKHLGARVDAPLLEYKELKTIAESFATKVEHTYAAEEPNDIPNEYWSVKLAAEFVVEGEIRDPSYRPKPNQDFDRMNLLIEENS